MNSNFNFTLDFDKAVAEMKARHDAGVKEMYAKADAIRQEMAAEREALDAKFQERLSAIEEQQVAAAVDNLITNICMLVNTTRRFS